MFAGDATKVPLRPWFHTKMNHGAVCLLNVEPIHREEFTQHPFVAQILLPRMLRFSNLTPATFLSGLGVASALYFFSQV